MRCRLTALALLLASTQLLAQSSAPPSFEAVSVKRNTSNDATGFATPQPGRFTVVNVPLRPLILRAYGIQSFQLIGGEGWLDADRFDITATTSGNPTPAQINLLLQQLLADRFGPVVRRETRELPVYHLVRTRADRLGPSLKPTAESCGPDGRPATAPTSGPQTFPPGLSKGVVTGCRLLRTPGWLMAAGQPMTSLAASLIPVLGRPVIDRTGIAGNYDFSVSYLPDDTARPSQPLPAEFPPIDPHGAPLLTALQEQLGLRVDSQRGPVDVVVIDRVSRPTDN